MKKLLSIFFLFAYLSSTAGISLQLHYCHGFVSNVTLGIAEEDPCICSDKSDKNCCSDEFKYIKLDEKHVVKSLEHSFGVTTYLMNLGIEYKFKNALVFSNLYFALQSNPPPNGASKQVLFSVFRI